MNNHAIILTLLFILLLKANDHSQYFRIGKKTQRTESSCRQLQSVFDSAPLVFRERSFSNTAC